jgi:hypothetical protein
MEQANKLPKEEMIELLIFNKKDIQEGKIDFRWIHSREFKYNGDMYDIVKKEETDKKLFFYCINDTKEKKLEEEFGKRVHKNSLEDKQRPASNNFVSISEPVQSENTGNSLASECTFSFWLTEFYQSLNLDIPSPPPRLA